MSLSLLANEWELQSFGNASTFCCRLLFQNEPAASVCMQFVVQTVHEVLCVGASMGYGS
jgi:hypothetical protein